MLNVAINIFSSSLMDLSRMLFLYIITKEIFIRKERLIYFSIIIGFTYAFYIFAEFTSFSIFYEELIGNLALFFFSLYFIGKITSSYTLSFIVIILSNILNEFVFLITSFLLSKFFPTSFSFILVFFARHHDFTLNFYISVFITGLVLALIAWRANHYLKKNLILAPFINNSPGFPLIVYLLFFILSNYFMLRIIAVPPSTVNLLYSITIYAFALNCLLFIAITFYFFDKSTLYKRKISSLRSYAADMESANTTIKAFKHDYQNIIYTLEYFISQKNYEGLEEYYYEILNPSLKEVQINEKNEKLIQHINLDYLRAFILNKINELEIQGIKLLVEIKNPIFYLPIEPVHILRILSNLINNAADAAKKSPIKKVRLALLETPESFTIIITNSVTNLEIPPLSELIKRGASTKGHGRGEGIANILDILENYPASDWEINTTHDYFTFKVVLVAN